jgi:fatty-acyl-CoA synthase
MLANTLNDAGTQKGERIATIAWNNYRHVEIYYAVSGIGAVVHTINPRLLPQQIAWMISHAEDTMVFYETTFQPIVDAIKDSCPTVKSWVVMASAEHVPESAAKDPNIKCYEDLIKDASDQLEWPTFDENSACTLCYTSGTTGDPKGVLYSHRSTVLHAWSLTAEDVFQIGANQIMLLVVPMFHISAWGAVYACAMAGTKMVMPGPFLDGENLAHAINQERVSIMAGVPTVWIMLLEHCRKANIKLPTVKNAYAGGAALPEWLLKAYEDELNIPMRPAWGMTETSPLGVVNNPLPEHENMDKKELRAIHLYAGRRIYGVDMRIVDDEDKLLPEDGKAIGHLHVKGPWVASAYYKGAGKDAFTKDGWFRTGDIAKLYPSGHMEITDRAKDIIKSGGEWISSIEVENAACDHEHVALAACIAMPDKKHLERPMLIVQPVADKTVDVDEVLDCVKAKVVKWWVPDKVVIDQNLPIGATGKVLKRKLKEKYIS